LKKVDPYRIVQSSTEIVSNKVFNGKINDEPSQKSKTNRDQIVKLNDEDSKEESINFGFSESNGIIIKI